MKKPVLGGSNFAAPRPQKNWDWRAASNFIAGGAGGALLFFASIGGFEPAPTRMAILLALILIGCGLTCVWFEIGRPLRALNVYRHFATSWMTREAFVALAVFATGGLAWLLFQPLLALLAGAAGLAFLYSQARILAANKGIPAWRHPRSISLMVTTGLAEGAGFLACVASLSGASISFWHAVALLALIAIRAVVWKGYLAGLTAGGAPEGALRALNGIAPGLVLFGHVLPAFAVAAALTWMPGRGVLMFAAGALVVAGGWFLKYTLVRRAAYTQGLAMMRMPVRGSGPAGPAAKPGWKPVQGAKAG